VRSPKKFEILTYGNVAIPQALNWDQTPTVCLWNDTARIRFALISIFFECFKVKNA
jgi:hypothetical protein